MELREVLSAWKSNTTACFTPSPFPLLILNGSCLPATATDLDSGRSTFGMNQHVGGQGPISPVPEDHEEEGAGLIAHAQDNPSSREPSPFDQFERDLEDHPYESDLGYRGAATQLRQEPQSYASQTMTYQDLPEHQQMPGNAISNNDYYQAPSTTHLVANQAGYRAPSSIYEQRLSQEPDHTQQAVGAALWGDNPHQSRNGPVI